MKKKTALWIFLASVVLVLPGWVVMFGRGYYGRCLLIFALFLFAYRGLMKIMARRGQR